MAGERLNKAQIAILERGFYGPRPGSNTFPLLQLGSGESRLNGEDLEVMIRAGYLTAVPTDKEFKIKGGNAGPYGEIPDVELSFAYRLTASGFTALRASLPSPLREGR